MGATLLMYTPRCAPVPYIETSVIAVDASHRDLRALRERRQGRKKRERVHTHLLHTDGVKEHIFERKEKGKGRRQGGGETIG